MSYCTNCGADIGEAQTCVICGTPNLCAAPTVTYPMKWYKFLIYFSLFAGALINAIGGLPYLVGDVYFAATGGEVTSELVYLTYPGLKAIDMAYGVLLIALALFGIVTRFRLSGFKKDGPMCLYLFYGFSIVISVCYPAAVAMTTDLSGLLDSTLVTSIITSVVMIILNYIYFNKRKYMFVN